MGAANSEVIKLQRKHTALDPDCYCWYLCDIRGTMLAGSYM